MNNLIAFFVVRWTLFKNWISSEYATIKTEIVNGVATSKIKDVVPWFKNHLFYAGIAATLAAEVLFFVLIHLL